MPLFTTTDRDNVKSAMVAAAIDGIASCTVAGQSVTGRSLDELRKLLDLILADLASGNAMNGLRVRQLKPGECG